MTHAVVAPTSTSHSASQTLPVVILGTDALLAALPATPVQLAHACLRAGFASVIPASWGDELIAAAVLRQLPAFGTGPAIQCSCPIVAHRLLSVGGDLRPALLALVPPPVAIARYVKRMSQPTSTRITFVGACPGAVDDAIDIRMTPESLIALLGERDILLDEQPRVFESIIPPDRRRFRSQPGGLPTAEALWTEFGARTIAEIEGEDLVAELAQLLLSGKNVLIDAAARLGCSCSGAIGDTPPKSARANVVALEPPRATTPIVEENAPVALELPVPAAPRAPVDILAVPIGMMDRASAPSSQPPAGLAGSMPLGHRISPVRGLGAVSEPRPQRTSSPVNPRPVVGSVPVARDIEGKSLPRAYVARRRSSPKGMPAISLPLNDEPIAERTHAGRPATTASSEELSAVAQHARPIAMPEPPATAPAPTEAPPAATVAPEKAPSQQSNPAMLGSLLSSPLTVRHAVLVLIAILAFALSISTVVAIVVGRALRQAPPAAAPVQR